MSAAVTRTHVRKHPPADQPGTVSDKAVSLESPSILQRTGYLLVNPWKNFLLPAGWLRKRLQRSQSPLVAESFVRPGGWRSMEIIYRNQEPVDWFDRQALRDNPISMAARNRRLIVTQKIAALIARYGPASSVTVVGVRAGPGRHLPTARLDSGI